MSPAAPIKLTLLLRSGQRVQIALPGADPRHQELRLALTGAPAQDAVLTLPVDDPAWPPGAVLHLPRSQLVGVISHAAADSAAPPAPPPAPAPLPRPWQEWLAQNLMRGADPAALAARLPQHGQDAAAGLALCQALSGSPLLAAGQALYQQLRKRDWLLSCHERLERLHDPSEDIPRRHALPAAAFLAEHYAAHRPVILTGLFDATRDPEVAAMAQALHPQTLRVRLGQVLVEIQGDRDRDPGFEENAPAHKRRVRLGDFIDRVEAGAAGNNAYLTAQNMAANEDALGALLRVPLALDGYLDRAAAPGRTFLWYGPAGTVTPLHHDRTNNLIAQLRGRKRVRLISAAQTPSVYPQRGVFSPLDLDRLADPLQRERYPLAQRLRVRTCVLAPGELLFVPVGTWHDVRALDVSVSVTYTGFRWENRFSDPP